MAIGQHNLFNFWPRKVYDGSISTNIGSRNSFFMLFCHFDVNISFKMQNFQIIKVICELEDYL